MHSHYDAIHIVHLVKKGRGIDFILPTITVDWREKETFPQTTIFYFPSVQQSPLGTVEILI